MLSWEINFEISITFLTTILKLEFYSYRKQMVQTLRNIIENTIIILK